MKAGNVNRLCTAVALCAVAGLAMTAEAGPKPRKMKALHEVRTATPTRVASVRLDMSTGRPRVTRLSEWMPHQGSNSRADYEYVFDAYESDTGGVPGGGPTGGDACAAAGLTQPSSRWFFGAGNYQNPFHAVDATLEAGAGGGMATHVDWGFHVNTNPAAGTQYYIFCADVIDDTCEGPSFSGLHDGASFDFTSFQFDPAFYYSVNGDMTALGGIELPANDSGGGFVLIHGAGELTDGSIIIHPDSQPMLWANDDYGASTGLQWDDDTTACGSVNAPDGQHQVCECYTYDGAVTCPTLPVGAMVAVAAKGDGGPPACFADCDESGGLSTADFTCFRNAYLANNLAKADCDNSGTLSTADFTCFRNAYLAGCP